ncbi:oxidoreductase [Sphaerisporangium corydalis]|uniref:Oxidoreductase n=1 Tax=Sphaerisporangium corydalis TaxID=1441875 RepID=A0ABV9EWD6_9ACTN|nr:oxidoreductase [Sphaerisporangium corydalis]
MKIPDLSGSTAVVTGGNSGIGLPTAARLAAHGAHVILTSRDRAKGEAAVRQVLERAPGAQVELASLDLADLSSVRAFAAGLTGRLGGLDLLVNNAGIGLIPRGFTADGFETQLGTNHFGHFALTGLLLPLLLARPGARVVTVSSDAHNLGKIDFDDLTLEKGYGRMSAYARSKLANLLFTLELGRRARAAGADLLSVASHPGMTATNFLQMGVLTGPVRAITGLFAYTAEQGAEPSLYAATSPDIQPGDFIGPKLKKLKMSARARDEADARRLWELSADLTGVRFEEFKQRV